MRPSKCALSASISKSTELRRARDGAPDEIFALDELSLTFVGLGLCTFGSTGFFGGIVEVFTQVSLVRFAWTETDDTHHLRARTGPYIFATTFRESERRLAKLVLQHYLGFQNLLYSMCLELNVVASVACHG